MNNETAWEIELAISHYFGTRTHIIIPNLSWGMFPYEMDLCILNNRSFYASEVEIKISKSDLKRDGKKGHNHDCNDNMIRQLWFAMPDKLENCADLVTERAGILLVSPTSRIRKIRQAKINVVAKKWTMTDAFNLARLGTIRMWNLNRASFDAKKRVALEAV
jgi:hypothetical protein